MLGTAIGLSLVVGLGAGLGVSASAHAVTFRLWVPIPPALEDTVRGSAELGAAVGLALGGAKRLLRARERREREPTAEIDPFRREVTRVALAAAVATLGALVLGGMTREVASTPLGAGFGLLVTAIALGTSALGRAPSQAPEGVLVGAVAGGAAAIGALPGGAPLACAFVALRWLRIAPVDALELALLAAAPVHLVAALSTEGFGRLALEAPSTVALTLSAAFGASLGGAHLFRQLARRSVAPLAAYVAPLGLALLAYVNALG